MAAGIAKEVAPEFIGPSTLPLLACEEGSIPLKTDCLRVSAPRLRQCATKSWIPLLIEWSTPAARYHEGYGHGGRQRQISSTMGATRVSVPHAQLQDGEGATRKCGTPKLWDIPTPDQASRGVNRVAGSGRRQPGRVSKLIEIEGSVISGSAKTPQWRLNRQGDHPHGRVYSKGRAGYACLHGKRVAIPSRTVCAGASAPRLRRYSMKIWMLFWVGSVCSKP